MQMATAAPQISKELLAGGPDIAIVMGDVALSKTSLSSI
jgi:hypothetical protein